MGGVPINQKSAKPTNMLECLLILFEDIEFLLPEECSKKLKNLTKDLPKIKIDSKIKPIFEMLRKARQPRMNFDEDIQSQNVSSFFQNYLLTQNYKEVMDQGDIKHHITIISTIRLMNFANFHTIKEPSNDYLKQLIRFINVIIQYCQLLNTILKKVDLNIGMSIYTIIWEQLQIQMPYLADLYNLNQLNKVFNDFYEVLDPPLRVECIIAKIWGTTVQDCYFDHFLEEFMQCRKKKIQSQLPLSAYFRSILDFQIDQNQLNWIGSEHMEVNFQLQTVFKKLDNKKYLEELLADAKGFPKDLLDAWRSEEPFLKTIFPIWVVENYFSKQFFEFTDQLIMLELKMLTRQEQTKLYKKFQQSKQKQQNSFMPPTSLDQMMDFDQFMMVSPINNQKPSLQIQLEQLEKQQHFSSIVLSSTSTQGSHFQYFSNISDQGLENPFTQSQQQQQQQQQQQLQSGVLFVQSKLVDSSLDEEENNHHHIPSQADHLEQFGQEYDSVKMRVLDSIQNRNNKIMFRNQQLANMASTITKIFDFTHIVTESDVEEIKQYLGNNKNYKQILVRNQQQVQFGNTMAEHIHAIKE